ncbi:MAG: adenine deaminase, partial [Clostridia bacterium]|nr:adenine deaminase [Clostridia bacterium]
RIAYVGPSEAAVGRTTRVVDVTGLIVVPGYVEPHTHVTMCYNPVSFARAVAARGTTALVADNLILLGLLGPEGFAALRADLARVAPVRFLWGARLAQHSPLTFGHPSFPPSYVDGLLAERDVVTVAEITNWPALVDGDPHMVDGVLRARELGRRVDGHHPGASVETLMTLAAAGVTACHEAIRPEEVRNRLRAGMYAMLRHSSLRPDVPALARVLTEWGLPSERLMLTADGPSPSFLDRGYLDAVVRLAVDAGVEPVTALAMVTVNPASYLGLDGELGIVAPGRLADLCLLRRLEEATPVRVFLGGEEVAVEGELLGQEPQLPWESYGFRPFRHEGRLPGPDDFRMPHHGREAVPVLHLASAAITRRQDRHLPQRDGRVDLADVPGACYAALVARDGRAVATGVLSGFVRSCEAVVSTYTTSLGAVVVGRDPAAMAQAYRRVLELGGGIVVRDGGDVIFELPLDIGGLMSRRPAKDVARAAVTFEKLLAERGHPFHDPLSTLLFLGSDALPDLRLTAAGLVEVKTRRVLRPSVPLV